jgi:putative methionine-R-sulfoxide reductase with GAF domain
MILDNIKETLESARTRLNAASCTFYVCDPFWNEEMRLIAMPGVRLTEPMHGFCFPPHSKRVLVEGAAEIFSSHAPSNEQLREDASSPLDRIDHKKRFLFGDFIEREDIKSSARLLHIENGQIKAVLFVNFATVKEFDEHLQEEIRKLLVLLTANMAALRDELRISETDALVQAIRIFSPTLAGAGAQLNDRDQPLEEYLLSLLDLAINALELDPDTTFGTVHLYDRQTETLGLVAYTDGYVKDIETARAPQSVPTGEGVISWVALRRKALLINNLQTSEFKSIHIPINAGMSSEVAIPIFDGNELVGVLDLESSLPDAFQPTCVRSLWFAVNRAAVAYRLRQQANINDRLKTLTDGLLELCGEVVDKGTGDFSLNRLADLAANELQAARCGIWHYNAQDGKFELAGVSPPNFKPQPPRSNGLSSFIRRFGQPVWIYNEAATIGFRISYWNGNEWEQPPTDLNTPEEINASVKLSVKSLVGIPIKVRGQFTGIAWLEYENNPETSSGNELLKLASGFAAYAGLVIEFSLFDLVDKNAVQRIGGSLADNHLASGPLQLEEFPHIEGYVKLQPYPFSLIGGDFYAARVIDEQTACVLLGDGMGHAVTGALNMLPMLTVFEAFWKESRSAVHLMDKIMSASNKLGVQGTAIYCVFTLIQKTLWVSVTSAGHPSMTIVKQNGMTLPFPAADHPASGGMLGAMLKLPLAEQQTELSSGDLIIIATDGFNMSSPDMAIIGLEHIKEDPKTIAEAVFQEACNKRNREGSLVDDDETVLVIRVK